MDATAPTKPNVSKVPRHLRRFHHKSRSCSDLKSEAPYSYSFAPPKPADPVELCPPHWQLPEKQRPKTRLRAILLKDWQSLQSQSVRERTPERPRMMRMKDSDDYITARAANPRTGLISPSVGSPSPYTPLTPGSPAEALKLRKKDVEASPTLDVRARPTLRRANEGRKVSAGSTWRADCNGWTMDGAMAAASPRVTNVEAGAGLVSNKGRDEDRFVVNMPSAREPQPYAFPGYSAKQIEAFEHYKEKARKVSGEGYDQRILQVARRTSGKKDDGDDVGGEHTQSQPVRAFSGDSVALSSNRDITLLKR